MNELKMHPPADQRCQIYVSGQPETQDMLRCLKPGIQWIKWSGCGCDSQSDDCCEEDFFSWECDGKHHIAGVSDVAA